MLEGPAPCLERAQDQHAGHEEREVTRRGLEELRRHVEGVRAVRLARRLLDLEAGVASQDS